MNLACWAIVRSGICAATEVEPQRHKESMSLSFGAPAGRDAAGRPLEMDGERELEAEMMRQRSKRRLLFASVLLFSIAVLSYGALAHAAIESSLPLDAPTIPAPTPTATSTRDLILPPPAPSVEVSLVGGPSRFCPGWNLWYVFRLTNTSALPMTNVEIKDPLPMGVWSAVNGAESTLPMAFDASTNTVVWQQDLILPGETVVAAVVLRTFTTLPDGHELINTFEYVGFPLEGPRQASLGLRVDSSICEPTRTATPTPTLEPTATPTLLAAPEPTASPVSAYLLCLPMIVWR